MPNFNEDKSYDPLFVKPEDPSHSEQAEQAEQITARINKIKNALEKTNNLLKNKNLLLEDRLKLEVTAAICRVKLKEAETRFRNAAEQRGIQLQ